ncbi:MAG TPA: M48 family metallopeptidase [Blastocatellia bacterium]|nr:M48 family metallopeptidase [Blastocatellia bacterium]
MASIVFAQEPSPAQPSQSQSATTIQSVSEPLPITLPEPSEKALSYYHGGVVLWVLGTIWGLAIPALLLFTGLSARIRDLSQRIGKSWFFTIAFYVVILSTLGFLIDLPFAYYQDYAREHAYGLSNQTFTKWFGDLLIAQTLALMIGVLILWIPYLLLKKSPRRWWLYTGLGAIPFLLIAVLIKPIWIDPLFNKFGPMQNKALETRILSLAERAGIEGSRVYEVAKSEDTNAVNAYVTGFGNTQRIVLWDTILTKLDEDELLFVMGHEMGHYVLGHVWKTILFFSALIIATLYAIHRTAGWLIHRYEHRFGFNQLSDIASLPLIILLFSAYIFVVSPVALAFSRFNEHEADRFGLEITHNNHSAAVAFVKLQQENLGVPRPGILMKWLRSTHPPLGERVDFCNSYRPWEKGEPLKYESLFRGEK